MRARQSGGHTHTQYATPSAQRERREKTPLEIPGRVPCTISVSQLSDAQDATKRTHNDLVCAIGTCTNEEESSSVDKK